MNKLIVEMKDLVDTLNKHTKLYDEGHPIISDKQWDDMYFRLCDIEKTLGIVDEKSPTQNISYEVVNELSKVKHNHFMSSLDKTKDWKEFASYFGNRTVVAMLKLDGLTCSLKYVGGRLVSAETRGDGHVGEDILHNARVIKSIPNRINYQDELVIDGEIICDIKTFNDNFSDKYANARNFAAGSIRLLNSKECSKRGLTFIAWNVVKGFEEINSFYQKMNMLNSLNFTTTPWTVGFDLDSKEYLVNKSKELGYPIDGLVGRFDDIAYGESLGQTDHHSKAALAFKFYNEGYETTLKAIEWSMGRTGVLTPVAVVEPIEIEGTMVERASLHNVSVLKETLGQPFEGQKVKIAKMNEIIPQVVWAEKIEQEG